MRGGEIWILKYGIQPLGSSKERYPIPPRTDGAPNRPKILRVAPAGAPISYDQQPESPELVRIFLPAFPHRLTPGPTQDSFRES